MLFRSLPITVYGKSTEDKCSVIGNWFEQASILASFRSSTDYPPGWDFINNIALGASGQGSLILRVGGPSDFTYNNTVGNSSSLEKKETYLINNGSLNVGETEDIDPAVLVSSGDLDGNSTYGVIAKMNNGNGSYDCYGRYIVSMSNNVVISVLVVEEVSSFGRSFTYSGGTITAASTSFGSAYELLFTRMGPGGF